MVSVNSILFSDFKCRAAATTTTLRVVLVTCSLDYNTRITGWEK